MNHAFVISTSLEIPGSNYLLDWVWSRVLHRGSLRVIDSTGRLHEFGNGQGPFVTLRLLDPSLPLKLALNPSLSLGEAYMDGDLVLEDGGLPDLMELICQNARLGLGQGWLEWEEKMNFALRRLQQLNPPIVSIRNASHHYDLSSDFYSLFLDSEKQYSCAYFGAGDETLELAQMRKMRHIAGKLLLDKTHRVLDIGCGWGGLARFIARETGASVLGITLSKEQLEEARRRTKEEGLDGLVKFELVDYRHVTGRFDRIVSVGIFEHVGVNHYGEFFDSVRDLLKDDGLMLLHSIGRSGVPSATNPWIRKYIFPGGYIPSLSEVLPHVEKAGLYAADIEILRFHYAKTLREWSKRFKAARAQVRSMYGERFCRMWEFYLAGSEAAFRYLGHMVFHLQMSKRPGVVPITRDYLYED